MQLGYFPLHALPFRDARFCKIFGDQLHTLIIFSSENDTLVIDFFAQTFLWHQIRRIISVLIKIGSNKLEKEQIIDALDNPNKKVDFGLAPAEPLVLMDVVYDFEFEYDKKLLKKLSIFEEKIFTSLIG